LSSFLIHFVDVIKSQFVGDRQSPMFGMLQQRFATLDGNTVQPIMSN
jgi:hypothetical protein